MRFRALAAAAPRRLAAGLRIAALEHRLRQDPGDVARRTSVAAFYCRQACSGLQACRGVGTHGEDGGDQVLLQESLGRAKAHLEFILQATDSIDRLHQVLTHTVGPRLFYQLPEVVAKYMRKIGVHRECLEEFDSRSEFEERATQYHFANALAVLKAAGCKEEAQELFEEALALEWKGRRPVQWRQLHQTPAVYISGLRHLPFWEGSERPALADILEDSWLQIAEDIRGLAEGRSDPSPWGVMRRLLLGRSRRPLPQQVPAYPNLVEESGGVWDMLQLYSSRRWHDEACALLPRTTRLLKRHLPSTDVPYVHYNTEEVVLFLLAPGSSVRLHNGGSNAPLNLHLGLTGCEGAHLEVAGQARALSNGKVLCFDDGTDHRVWHEGEEERWVLTVRLMHPELARQPAEYFGRAFTRRTCFEAWDERRAAELVARQGP